MEILEMAHALLRMFRGGVRNIRNYWVPMHSVGSLATNLPISVERTENVDFPSVGRSTGR